MKNMTWPFSGKILSLFTCVNLYITAVPLVAATTPEPTISRQSGIYTNDSLTFTISSSPSSVVRVTFNGSIPTTNSAIYTSAITVATNAVVKARSFSSIEGIEPSSVVSRTFLFLDGDSRGFSSSIPVIIVNTLGRPIPSNVPPGGDRLKGSLTVINNNSGRASLEGDVEYHGLAEFELVGQTSAGFPQYPIRIEIQDEEFRDRAVSLLGMPAEADWRLRSTYNVKSLINDMVGYELWEKMGHYSLRRKMVEVFVDRGGGRLSYQGDYFGVMTLTETLERGENRVDIADLDPEDTNAPAITGGYIIKKDKDGPGDLNFTFDGGNGFAAQTFKLHDPKPNELRGTNAGGRLTASGSNQMAFLTGYLNSMARSLYSADWLAPNNTNHYSNYLDTDSFADYHWMVEFPKFIDGFRIDFYMHKDRNGKFKAGPVWDWDLAFGNSDYLQGGWTNGWYYQLINEAEHPLYRRLVTGSPSPTGNSGDPEFTQKIADRWGTFRTTIFGTNLLHRIEELAVMLDEPAQRHHMRWQRLGIYDWPQPRWLGDGRDVNYAHPLTYRDGTTNSIIGQMQQFMLGRFHWVDEQFAKAPHITMSGGIIRIECEPGASISYTLDGSDPRYQGGAVSPTAFTVQSPHLIPFTSNVVITARAHGIETWKSTWSPVTRRRILESPIDLRITEVMYHAEISGGGSLPENDYDFIELYNAGSTTINLEGFRLEGGIQLTFTNGSLASGERGIVTANPLAFTNSRVLGTFEGNLSNSGEEIRLVDPFGEASISFTYSDLWYPATDGEGFSLVANGHGNLNHASSWSASTVRGGSPGSADSVGIVGIYINELLRDEDGLSVEIYNANSQPASIGGWYLYDLIDGYRLVLPSTLVPASGYAVLRFTLALQNTNSLWLVASDSSGLTGYSHRFQFEHAPVGTSLGRVVAEDGTEFVGAEVSPTLGATNAGWQRGPVFVTEVHFHPFDNGFLPGISFNNSEGEFIEIANLSSNNVMLGSGWSVAGDVNFTFRPGMVLGAGEYAVLVPFSPSNSQLLGQFRRRYNVPTNTQIFGPWVGILPNSGATVSLKRSGSPVDSVLNLESVAVSGGFSSQLNLADQNWVSSMPSPGLPFRPEIAPGFLLQPTNQIAALTELVSLRVSATGSSSIYYQWFFRGNLLRGATNSILNVGASAASAGEYKVIAYNNGGFVESTNALLTVRPLLQVVDQPQGVAGVPGTSNLVLQVAAEGAGILSYQWYLNNVLIPGATNSSYQIPPLAPGVDGTYKALITDTWTINGWSGVSQFLSAPAEAIILLKPEITVQPLSRAVVEGGTVTFAVAATGTHPMYFRWRTNGSSISTAQPGYRSANTSYSFLTLTNVRPGFITNISVVLTNLVEPGKLSAFASLMVAADSDRDGLPDSFEAGKPGFSPNSASDSLRDDDGDGLNNAAEFKAGTDMADSNSVLKVSFRQNGGNIITFNAVAGVSYTLQSISRLDLTNWVKVADVLPSSQDRQVTLIDIQSSGNRFYRIVTPLQP